MNDERLVERFRSENGTTTPGAGSARYPGDTRRLEVCMRTIVHFPPVLRRTLVATPSRSAASPVFGSILNL